MASTPRKGELRVMYALVEAGSEPVVVLAAALAGALGEATRLSEISEHLLTLARYERGAGLAMERGLDLTALLYSAAREVTRSTGGEVRDRPERSAPPV